MPELSNALLETLLEQVHSLTTRSEVASYIPALALAIAIVTPDGQLYQAGEA